MKFSIIISFTLAITLSIFSCKKADVQFGSEFLDNGLTQIIRIDSFKPSLSTVYVDSFVTSAKGGALIGSYNDEYFGRISSETFFDIAPPTYSNIYANTQFDSIKLILKPNSYFYGDTTKPIHLSAYRLTELIASKNYDLSNQYYNNQSFASNNLLGSESKLVFPQRKETVELRLNDTLGTSLLSKLQDPNNSIMKTVLDFQNYFNGIKIAAGSSDNVMIGFSDSITMRVYYRKVGPFPQYLTADFSLSSKAHQFNHITVNRSNINSTVLKNIGSSSEIPSALTDNIAYCQPASGLMTKVKFNTVNDIQRLPNYAKILKAQLIVRPILGSYSKNISLPPALRLSTSNSINQIVSDLMSYSSTGASYVQYGDLVTDYLNGTGTKYTYDVTDYIKSLLNNPTAVKNGLLITPPNPLFENEVNRVLIGDNKNVNGKTELIIFYASIQ